MIGAGELAFGEVVFNTAMSGYQEILTDPSYTGQLVTMTYPLIGNYGVNATDRESSVPQVAGFVVREASRVHSNWRAEQALRPAVVNRKVSGGNRTIRGAATRQILTSVVQTARLRGLSPRRVLVDLLHAPLPTPSPTLSFN